MSAGVALLGAARAPAWVLRLSVVRQTAWVPPPLQPGAELREGLRATVGALGLARAAGGVAAVVWLGASALRDPTGSHRWVRAA